ncbi:MAG: tetratricopeptide repeat protein [Acidobacteria bacterium]|nr:tetratricopeptide repeat protein [Acidobacteriota bacterium]
MVFAQRPGGGGGGAAGGGGAGGATGRGGGGFGNIPGTNPTTTRPTQPSEGPGAQRPPFEQRPLFLSGKVMLEDGTPPPEPVVIERVCNGIVRPESYTDSKGHFNFQFGRRDNMIMDASVGGNPDPGRPFNMADEGLLNTPSGNLGQMNLSGCEIRASLAGFRSNSIQLMSRSIFDNSDLGVIVLHRIANVAGSAISATSLSAPKEAKKSYEKAQKLLSEKTPKRAEAAKELEKAVQAHPQYAAAWSLLGQVRMDLKDEEGARKAFEQSIAADSRYINPYIHLAELELRASRWEAAANLTDRLAALNPQLTQAQYFNAVANFNLGKMDVAEKSARSALKNDDAGRYPQTHHLLGTILARQGRFPSAADEYRTYLTLLPGSPTADQLRKVLTEWEGLGVIERAKANP